jgi:hypothetical protein
MRGFRPGHEPRRPAPTVPNVFRYHVAVAWAGAGETGFLDLGFTAYREPLTTHEQIAAMREQVRRSITIRPKNDGGPMIVGAAERCAEHVAILTVTLLDAGYMTEEELDKMDPRKAPPAEPNLANIPPATEVPQ